MKIYLDVDFLESLEKIGVTQFLDTLSSILRKKNEMIFPHECLKTPSGLDSLSQTSLYHATFGSIPEGAHQAHEDVENLIQMMKSAPFRDLWMEVNLLKLGDLFSLPKEKRKARTSKACSECGMKRHTKKSLCSLKKK